MPVNRTITSSTDKKLVHQRSDAADASIIEQFNSLTSDFLTLVRQEARLAKVETGEKILSIMRHTLMIGVGCFVAYAGLIVLMVAVAIGYGEFLPLWFSAVLVSLLLFISSIMVIYTGRRFWGVMKSSDRSGPKRTPRSVERHAL